MDIHQMGKQARSAARRLALISGSQRAASLRLIAERLWEKRADILAANQQDLADGQQAGLTPALLDRLMLNEARLEGICADLRQVSQLPDPLNEIFEANQQPNGLKVHKQRVPLGVLAVIYEARPNVTVDVTGLAIMSGNCAILRGGSETLRSNCALAAVIRQALGDSGLPANSIQLIDDPDRRWVSELLQMDDDIDMVIPRGGAGLHEFCRKNSRIPVITGGIGICHLFVDQSANLDAAIPVIRNAKIQRPSVCNALDTTLVHQAVASAFIPRLVETLAADGVTFRADARALQTLNGRFESVVSLAGSQDFDTEWLSLVLGIRVVDHLDDAIAHIAAHSTHHSDGILTQDAENAQRFIAEVDSAAVYVNASTRFTDGGQLGLGAEVAISTQRLHARGPMGLRELTTYKWVIQGNYTIRK